MSNKKEIFKEYRNEILKNADHIKKLHNGEMPIIEGYDEIKDIIGLFNEAQEKWDWGLVFHKEFSINHEYEIHSLLSNFIRPLVNVEERLYSELRKYKRNYNYFSKEFEKIKAKLIKSMKLDKKENDKRVENGRMHDLSTGVFSHEEAGNRAMYNSLINTYKSEKTFALSTLLEDTYDRFFSYYYLKLEYISSLAIAIIPHKRIKIMWSDKHKAMNKLPLGKKISKKEYKRVMDVANHYKHQTILIGGLPTIEELDGFLNTIVEKLELNFNFRTFNDNVRALYDEIENILNPLGLTGME